MATIYKEFAVAVPAIFAWNAVKDVGSIHKRLVVGFVVDTVLENDVRKVTFGNGMVVKEKIITVSDDLRRLAYTAIGGRTTHHNAYVQVIPDGNASCRLLWVTDLLPNELAGPIGQMVEAGAAAMKKTLESAYQP